MITTPILSQRDPKWKDNKLGTSDVTIEFYGCIVDCLAMLAGRSNVEEVNQAMIDKNAFVQKNLTYWVKVPDALPELKFVWRNWSYDNNVVKDWIKKGFPVIVQVDAAPIGSPRNDHYVLYVGDQKCVDPWTGRIRPTADFPDVKGYVLYEATVSLEQRVKGILYSDDSDASKLAQLENLLPK